MHRRDFLTALGGAVGAGWLTACASRASLAPPLPQPGTSAGLHTAVLLDGRLAGWASARSPAALDTRGVPDYAPGSPPPPPPVAPVRFRDLVIDAPANMAPAFYAWAAACLAPAAEPRQYGQIVSVDASGRTVAAFAWQGYIDELAFPALDKSDCSPARLHLQVAIEHAQPETLSRVQFTPPIPPPLWRRCDFAVSLSGLGDAGGQVQAVSAFTCRRARRRVADGGPGLSMQLPVYSPLLLTLPAPAPAALQDWASSSAPQTAQLRYAVAANAAVIGLELAVQPELPFHPLPDARQQLNLRVLRANWIR